MKVAIIGCGLIGRKRAMSLAGSELVACADIDKRRADELAKMVNGAEGYSEWRRVLDRKDVELVVVATTHDVLAPITLAAICAGKHVLVEKPGARSASELEPLIDAAKQTGGFVRVGFNHRYHPAIRKARELFEAGAISELMYIRGRYGHGGRIGYEKEWRAKRELSGGGELIDQGVHLIDLARWFLGDFIQTDGFAHTYYWNMTVEDNAFLLLRTSKSQAAFLHVSCTEWKNLFSLELFGSSGKLEISGLGGSYGVERVALYRMLPEMGPPETTIWEYPMPENSWEREMAEFLDDIRLGRRPSPSLSDAMSVLRVVEHIYQKAGYDHHA